MTAEQISSLAAVLLSLAFSYFPNVDAWYAALGPVYKRLLMLGLLALAASGALLWECQFAQVCLAANWKTYLDSFVAAVVLNQTAFLLSPKSARVRAAIAR